MALSLLAANNAQTVLAAGISSTATSLTVNAGTGTLFPSPVAGSSFFKLTIIDAATGTLTEIIHVTARAGDVFTIQRGQEGTVPRAWSANDIAANMMTAGTLSYILGNFQPLDPTLTALAALVGVANKLPYFNGDDTAALTDLTQVGRDIIGKSTIADILTYLGLHETGFSTLTSSGSFTVPDGVTELWISGCAGGAGGGGSQTTSNVTVAGSGGGSSGGFVQRFKLTVTPGQVIPYTIGAAGTGGSAGGGIGGDGGNTTFGSSITLLGGKGGAVGQSSSDSASGGIGGMGGPTGSGGGYGSWGGDSQNINGGGAYGGKGGDCPFGSAGGQVRGNVNPIAGMDAVGYGAGGGGAGGANVNGAHAGAKGGNGAPGVLFIEW